MEDVVHLQKRIEALEDYLRSMGDKLSEDKINIILDTILVIQEAIEIKKREEDG